MPLFGTTRFDEMWIPLNPSIRTDVRIVVQWSRDAMQSECTRTVGQGEVYITSSTCCRREFFEKKRNLCKALKNVAKTRNPLLNKIVPEMEIEQSPLSLSEGICCQCSSLVQHTKVQGNLQFSVPSIMSFQAVMSVLASSLVWRMGFLCSKNDQNAAVLKWGRTSNLDFPACVCWALTTMSWQHQIKRLWNRWKSGRQYVFDQDYWMDLNGASLCAEGFLRNFTSDSSLFETPQFGRSKCSKFACRLPFIFIHLVSIIPHRGTSESCWQRSWHSWRLWETSCDTVGRLVKTKSPSSIPVCRLCLHPSIMRFQGFLSCPIGCQSCST